MSALPRAATVAGGFDCPACGKFEKPYRSSRGRLVCRGCRHQCTVTAGTIFDKTRTPLRTWFAAVWYLTSQKFGVSALGLQRVLGLGSYQTSWAMLHRLRRAMVLPGRERLHGQVEVDEIYVGVRNARKRRLRRKKAGKSRPTLKTLVAVAIEIQAPKGSAGSVCDASRAAPRRTSCRLCATRSSQALGSIRTGPWPTGR